MDAEQPLGDHSPQDLETARKTMLERFRFIDFDDERMRALFNMGVQRVALRLAAGDESLAAASACGSGLDHPVPQPLEKQPDPLKLMEQEVDLPSIPQVVLELQRLMESPKCSSQGLAEVIAKDPGLSAFLLRLVNSSFYSFPSRIDTISRAVTVIGTRQLTMLAMGLSLMDRFNIEVEGLDLKRFWTHSMACGILARALAVRAGYDDPERFFVSGLIHDIGRLILFRVAPEAGELVLSLARYQRIPLAEAERRALGFTHAKLGGLMLRKWNLPFSLVAGVLGHHAPEAGGKHLEPAVVHLADVFATTMGYAPTDLCFASPLRVDPAELFALAPEDYASFAAENDRNISLLARLI